MSTFLYNFRSAEADRYVHALASLHQRGFRLYDPSLATFKDPDAEHKMMQWPAILAPLQIRHTAVAGRKWTVAPPDEATDAEKALAKLASKALARIEDFTGARMNLARADVSGARYAEIVWTVQQTRLDRGQPAMVWVLPTRLRDMAKENFRWVPIGGDRARARLEYAGKKDGGVTWAPVSDLAPLIRHRVLDSEERLGYGRGLRDVLIFLFTAMTRAFEADMQAVERFGHGWLVFKLDHEGPSGAHTNTALVTEASDALNKMRREYNFVIGKNDTLEMLAPPVGAQQFMQAFQERIERMADRVIMGGTLFSGGGSQEQGSRARAETEADTASGVFDVYADLLEETLTRDLVHRWCRENLPNLRALGLESADWPRFSIVRGRKQDPRESAEVAEIVLRSGARIKRDEYYDRVGFSEPGPDDDVIEPAPRGVDGLGAYPAPPVLGSVAGAPRGPEPARDVEDLALNGAQVTALQGLVEAVARKTMDPEAAMLVARSAFPSIPEERLRRMFAAAQRVEPEPVPAGGQDARSAE